MATLIREPQTTRKTKSAQKKKCNSVNDSSDISETNRVSVEVFSNFDTPNARFSALGQSTRLISIEYRHTFPFFGILLYTLSHTH